MKKTYYSLFLILLIFGCGQKLPHDAGLICRLTVTAGEFERNDAIATYPLDEITFLPDTSLILFEITENTRTPVKFQVDYSGNNRQLYWIIPGITARNKERKFELVRGDNDKGSPGNSVGVVSCDGGYEMVFHDKKVLKYNTETVYPPAGADTAHKRSGFINPLYAPDQTILTRIPDSASDHLHHYGLWNAWKKVEFRGEEIDFFAPQFGQGTVKHKGVISVNQGAVFGELKLFREHVVWQDTEKEDVAMSDELTIKVWNNNQDLFKIDLMYHYSPVDTFFIREYRYAGFSFRGTDFWTRENTGIFTSEGLTRDEADGERARWCVVNGETPVPGKAGLLMMSHPGNYNHPEPMRIWPSEMEKVGHVYLNFSPTKNMDWLLIPGKTALLRYRLVIAGSDFTAEEAERAWKEFSDPVKVVAERIKN